MNGQTTSAPLPGARTSSLAMACFALWLIAATTTGPLGIWSALGGTAVVLGLAIVVLDGRAVAELLQPNARRFVLGAVVGTGMAAGTHLLYPVFAPLLPAVQADTEQLYAAFRAPAVLVASVALVPVIVGEELVWRGVVQSSLMRRLGVWRGAWAAAVVYAFAHLPLGSPVLMAAALCCGLIWGSLRAQTGSLIPTLVAHVTWNVLVLLLFPLDGG